MTQAAQQEARELVYAPQNSTPLVPSSESAAILAMIERAARDVSIPLDRLQQLLEMREKVEARNAEREFDMAMSVAQAKIRPVAADSNNPQTKSKYASYAALDRALRPIYTDNGFSLSFNTTAGATADSVRVLCRVSHRGGHGRDYSIDMPADGKGAKGGDVMTKTHATGSAVSYGMRYLLKMIFNVAVGEDDDGNSAGNGGPISAEQLAELIELADEVGADKARFCKYMRVDSFAALPASRFKQAIDALNAKRAKP